MSTTTSELYTFKSRKRTVCIDINSAHPTGKASFEEWSDFLDEDLSIDPLEVQEVTMHSLTKTLMLQVFNEAEYHKILEKLQDGVTWTKHGTIVIGWSAQETMAKAKLLNVTQSMNLEALKNKISEYGKILSWEMGRHPRYKNSFDGTIAVKLLMKHDATLPNFLPSQTLGEMIHIVSDSITKACSRCLEKGHTAPRCRNPTRQLSKETKVWSWIPDPEEEEDVAKEQTAEEEAFLNSILVGAGVEEDESQETEEQGTKTSKATSLPNGKRPRESPDDKTTRKAKPNNQMTMKQLEEKRIRIKNKLTRTASGSRSLTENMDKLSTSNR